MADDSKQQNGKKPKKSGSWFSRLIQGRTFLNLQFFRRNWPYVVALVVMMLMYISNKYVYQETVRQVIKLQHDLQDANTDLTNAKAKYSYTVRESNMCNIVDTMHIDLTSPDQPPYKLNEE